ncbi:hypothetical protein OSB04_027517 [Centaurea solstitialis]|uniref:DUF630 domain-containing protein n=1 Tax=Centaurea solstitialis TaxID=347529 RepID=A0AA38WAB8_9ASTR|nr:hypothetical protein OSB04_027517 [Centaurea solstitialis]
MGCVGSKPVDSPTVALCRKRCDFLYEAIHQSYDLAQAHLAYLHSLKSVSKSLQCFFNLHSAAAVAGPLLQRKGDSSGRPPPGVENRHSRSNSGSSDNGIFLSCTKVQAIWTWFFDWCGLIMGRPLSIDQLLIEVSDHGTNKNRKKLLEAAVGGVLWHVWKARNNVVFNAVKGFSPLQKCASAIRQLAYGSASDAFDEYLRMSETMSRNCLDHFCKVIIYLYMRQYLRKPTATDVQAIYALHEQTHGLPGMLGSIDCMHWYWKNCPMAWRAQFHRGDHPGPSVILESVASQDQWIWHAFFGVPGATNDIIVVSQSPIFNDLFENKAPDSSFVVNNTHYNHGYYLADGIYPEWTTFVKAFRYPVEEPRVHFKTRQESARKDIERTFATLKDKWHVVKYPARVWTQRKLSQIMYTCIILHNMIREDEGFSHYPFDPTEVLPGEIETTISEEDRARNVNLVKNRERHANLRHDLSIHVWNSSSHAND